MAPIQLYAPVSFLVPNKVKQEFSRSVLMLIHRLELYFCLHKL